MSIFIDAIKILGAERVAEIRANVDELLKQVLANRERYARKPMGLEAQGQKQAA